MSDTSSVKIIKRKQRKVARRLARRERAKLKQDDPFAYYFGVVDPDKRNEEIRESRRA